MLVNTSFLENVAQSMLGGLRDLDRQLAPEGLYAAEEHPAATARERWLLEWNECLSVCLRSVGCQAAKVSHLGKRRIFPQREFAFSQSFILPNNELCTIELLRVSKVKVRKYGNAYRMDPSRHFTERWQSLGLQAKLKRQDRWPFPKMLLLVGFDDKERALAKELSDLDKASNWLRNGWSFWTLHWPDPHGRGFHNRAALWFTSSQHGPP